MTNIEFIEYEGILLKVEYFYSFEPEIHTEKNGSPGTPSNSEFEIMRIFKGEKDVTTIFARYCQILKTNGNINVWQEVEDLIYEEINSY